MTSRLVVLGLLCVVAVAPARGDDACLAGDSTLGDQHAIATLRADAESVCP